MHGCGALSRDHPRLRGEQGLSPASVCNATGSPPLARGTVFLRFENLIVDGITPACAGNSLREPATITMR